MINASNVTKTLGRVDMTKTLFGGGKIKNMLKKRASSDWQPTEAEIFFGDEFMEKDAAAVVMPQSNFRAGLMNGLGMAAAGALSTLAIGGASRLMQSYAASQDMRKYEEALRTAIQMSPTLQRHGFDALKGFLPMVAKASPTVASEPRLLANYLETMIDAEGHLNLATFGELASLENNLLKNQDSRNSLSKAIITEGAKSAIKGGVEAVTNNYTRNWGRVYDAK